MTIELFLRLLGSLALLIYGMKTMSDSLQRWQDQACGIYQMLKICRNDILHLVFLP